MRIPRSAVSLCSVGLLIGLGACSSSPGGSKNTGGSAAQGAASMLITASDVPLGWTASGKVQTGMSGDLGVGPAVLGTTAAQLASCLGTTANLDQNVPEAAGVSYGSKDQSQNVQEGIDSYPDAPTARAVVGAYAESKAPGCLETAFKSSSIVKSMQTQLPKGVVIGKVTAQDRSLVSLGDASVDLEMVVPASGNGIRVTTYVDYVMVAKGRIAAGITFIGVGNPVASDVVEQVSHAAASRLTS